MSLLIGSHLPLSGRGYFVDTVKLALEWGETAFMFYTGAPQNSIRAPIEKMRIEEARKSLSEGGIELSSMVVHAPYIVNLANHGDPEKLASAKRFVLSEMERSEAFGSSILVLHPGAHLGDGSEEGIRKLSLALDDMLKDYHGKVRIALETMAGKGSEIGRNLKEIASIIDHVERKELFGVCLDTCHLNDAGYDVHDVDGLLAEIDRIIGLDRVLAVHLNDSKNPRGSHKDRHENLGCGSIGFETLRKWAMHPLLERVPKILETPYYEGKPPYKAEISMLRSGEFDPDFRSRL